MNLPADSPVPIVPSETFGAARALRCPVCCSLAGEECAYTTAPVTLPVVASTEMRPMHGYHASRLDAAGANVVTTLGPTAIVWDDGDSPRRPIRPEMADRGAAQDLLSSVKETLDNLGARVGWLSVALSGPRGAVTELADELLDEPDDSQTYCTVCGHWVGIFRNLPGWQHFTGDPAAGGYRELYDADHEAVVAAVTPIGRALCPSDLRLIRQALARTATSCTDHDTSAAFEALAARVGGYLADVPTIAPAAGGEL